MCIRSHRAIHLGWPTDAGRGEICFYSKGFRPLVVRYAIPHPATVAAACDPAMERGVRESG